MCTVLIEKDLLRECHIAICSLKIFIDQLPPNKPLLWQVDKKTPVNTLPDYREATVTLDKLQSILYSG